MPWRRRRGPADRAARRRAGSASLFDRERGRRPDRLRRRPGHVLPLLAMQDGRERRAVAVEQRRTEFIVATANKSLRRGQVRHIHRKAQGGLVPPLPGRFEVAKRDFHDQRPTPPSAPGRLPMRAGEGDVGFERIERGRIGRASASTCRTKSSGTVGSIQFQSPGPITPGRRGRLTKPQHQPPDEAGVTSGVNIGVRNHISLKLEAVLVRSIQISRATCSTGFNQTIRRATSTRSAWRSRRGCARARI